MVGIQKVPEKPIVFVHVDDLKLCPGPEDISWVPGVPTAKSLCAGTVAFRRLTCEQYDPRPLSGRI